MWEDLVVVETENAIFVAYADDPSDWVACFEKDPAASARDWAERMVYCYNIRITLPDGAAILSGPASYHPFPGGYRHVKS